MSNWPGIATRSPVAVSVLFSLVLLTLFATVTLWLRFWHPLGLLEVECIISIVALLIGILRRHRQVLKPTTAILQPTEQS